MFRFSIADLGAFLGKSPVTIRAWERKGMLTLPRIGGTRSLVIADVRKVAGIALEHGRITRERLTLINEAMGALSNIEQENA